MPIEKNEFTPLCFIYFNRCQRLKFDNLGIAPTYKGHTYGSNSLYN